MSIIEFKQVSKSFERNRAKATSLKEAVIDLLLGRNRTYQAKSPKERFTVLDEASFELFPAETVGIIGENGTGKSTILKLIAQIYPPSAGEVEVRGTVASLLEVGAGFQGDLSGRENVYLYGAILGLSKAMIAERYQDIIRFAEMEDFMEVPVKHYSSGMYMRLAFSVAVHVDPDIILIDEVLAVGDEAFQRKCLAKVEEFQKRGKTILFVSHDMNTIRRISDRVIFVARGGEVQIGEPDKMVNLYLSHVYKKESDESQTEDREIAPASEEEHNRWGNRRVEIESVQMMHAITGERTSTFFTHDDIVVRLKIRKHQEVGPVVLGFAVFTEQQVYLADRNSYLDNKLLTDLDKETEVEFVIRDIPFLQGKYYLTLALYDESCQIPFDHQHQHYQFFVVNNREQMPCVVEVKCDWNF